jgi:hypothetical protein
MLHRFPDTLYHICVFLSFSHNLFVKNAESNTNGTIWSQGTDANAVTPLRDKLTRRVFAIDRADSKGNLSNITKIFGSRPSRESLPRRKSSWKYWWSRRNSPIQNWALRSASVFSWNYAWSLCIISWVSVPSFQKNLMITLWSYSIRIDY